MATNYFEKELCKIQQHFNETFGNLIVCDLRLRQKVILSIISMGRLTGKIARAKRKDDVRDEIRRFMKTRKILKTMFNKIERQQKERRNHEHYNIAKKEIPHAGGHTGR